MNSTDMQTFTVASNQNLFQREEKDKDLTLDTERGVKCPKRWDLTAVYIITSIDLYTFDWLLLLTYIISNQSG